MRVKQKLLPYVEDAFSNGVPSQVCMEHNLLNILDWYSVFTDIVPYGFHIASPFLPAFYVERLDTNHYNI